MIMSTNKQHIKNTFNKIYFLENETDSELESIQVKAEICESSPWIKNPYPRTLGWKEAEAKFLSELTEEQREMIMIKYNSEEYADLEEHDAETDCVTMTIIFKDLL